MLVGYHLAIHDGKPSTRTRAAYGAVLRAIVRDGQTLARAFGKGGWLPCEDSEPYPSAAAMFEAAQSAYDDDDVFWVSDSNHNGTLFTPTGNLLFRAHHDAIHCLHGFDFSLAGEVATARATIDTLHLVDVDACALLIGEVVGQALYFERYGHFPVKANGNQPVFHINNQSIRWASDTMLQLESKATK